MTSADGVPDGPFAGNEDATLSPEELMAERDRARAAALEPGRVLGGYTIVGVLGTGAMGAVYRARSTTLGRDVALKVLNCDGLVAPDAAARFRREARAAARLAGHANVAAVHDMGETDGAPWFVMDLVEGESLLTLIGAERLDDRRIARYLAQAARGVQHAHDHGVLHRDLKPANLMVGRDDVVRVTDFGLASITGAAGDGQRLTLEGAALGTPAYMPREQALGEGADERSDVYGLGATLFHALTGRTPVAGSSLQLMLEAVVDGSLPAVRSVRPDLHAGLAAVCDRALAPSPADRYATAAEFADDLERWLDGQAVRARGVWVARRLLRLATRHPWTSALLAVAAIAAIAAPLLIGDWSARADATDRDRRSASAEGQQAERHRQWAGAFRQLSASTTHPMQRLEDHWNGVLLDADGRRATLAAVDAAAAQAAAAYPASALPAAWRTFARLLAQDQPAQRAALAAAGTPDDATGDPFPVLLVARVHLLSYATAAALPPASLGEREVFAAPFIETPAMQAARRQAAALLDRALRSPAWAQLDQAREVEAFARAAASLGRREYDPAIQQLAPLADDPHIGGQAAFLCGIALHLRGRFAEAGTTFERLGRRGWPAAHSNAARAWMAAAVQARRDRRDPFGHAERAVAQLDRLVAARPGDPGPRNQRGIARWIAGTAMAEQGRDPGPVLALALADYDAALRLVPGDPNIRLNRANSHSALGRWAREQRRDPRPHYERALVDLEAFVAGAPQIAWARATRGSALLQLGIADQVHGADGGARLQRALADFRAVLAHDATRPDWQHAAGMAHAWLGERAFGRQEDPTIHCRAAIEAFTAELAIDASRGVARLERARAANTLGNYLLQHGRAGEAGECYRTAERGFTAALQAAPENPDLLTGRGGARVNLATVGAMAGGDPLPLAEAGIADLERSVALLANAPRAWLFLGFGHSRRAEALAAAGRTAESAAAWGRAAAALAEAAKLSPAWRDWLRPQIAAARAKSR